MKASIVIPAHNEEKYIAKTLEAVLKQDYHDFEVLVVDNASTDRTSEIVHSYPRVKLLYEPRKGLLWARECGRRHATGDIIVNTDADCIPDESWLSRGMSHFSSSKIVAVTGPCIYFDAGPIFQRVVLALQRGVFLVFSKAFQFLKIGAVLIGGNNFIRAETLQSIGGYNTAIEFYGEDTDTAKRLIKKGYVAFKTDVVTTTSSRRFVKEGAFHTSFVYVFYFLWVTFFKKHYTHGLLKLLKNKPKKI